MACCLWARDRRTLIPPIGKRCEEELVFEGTIRVDAENGCGVFLCSVEEENDALMSDQHRQVTRLTSDCFGRVAEKVAFKAKFARPPAPKTSFGIVS